MSTMSHVLTLLSSGFPCNPTNYVHHHTIHIPVNPVPLKFSSKNGESKRAVSLARPAGNDPPSTEAAAANDNQSDQSEVLISGSDVVRKFYEGINRHNLGAVQDLIAQDCVYEDLVFPRPFLGRDSILDFFGKFIDYVTTDLQFVIDAISEGDSSAVGVTWHLEWKGKVFPFSRGCSFYQLAIINGTRQIIYARDSVEPAIKPGESALVAIRGVTWLLQQFPNLADKL